MLSPWLMVTLGTFISGEYFFVVFIGADYNRCLWIYKITQFSCCLDKGWVVVVVLIVVVWKGGGWRKVLNVRRRGFTKIEQGGGGVQILVILWERNNLMPPSNICPGIAMGVFKGFLLRALLICSEKYLAQEIKFLINVFAENGRSVTVLEKVTKEYMNNITSVK